MRSNVNISPSQAQAHYQDLLAAIGANTVDAGSWVERRDVRRQARLERRAIRQAARRRLSAA